MEAAMSETTTTTTVAAPIVDISQVSPEIAQALIQAFLAQQAEAKSAAKIAAEEARQAHAALVGEIRADAAGAAATLLAFRPVKASEKEGATWVGAIVNNVDVTIDGRAYSVTVTVKDIAATDERKAAAGK
jgi:hypothetical protein